MGTAKDEAEENTNEAANDRAYDDAMRPKRIEMRKRAEQGPGGNHE